MDELFGEHMTVTMPTRSYLTDRNYRHFDTADYIFLCGTNLVASNMNKRRQWDLRRSDKRNMKNVIMLGVGWWQYQDKANAYTNRLLHSILRKDVLHSVRDHYTLKKFQEIGINNVVNTACPTMWQLTPEKINRIPRKKSDSVITTLTNYHKDNTFDRLMFDILFKNYSKVYIWLQAIEDYEQLASMGLLDKVQIIAPTLKSFDIVLSGDVDYVGTRLHGGIHALNHEKRTLIVAVDNRAMEISRDTGLPVIARENVMEELDRKINSSEQINIQLPWEEIDQWKKQFIK